MKNYISIIIVSLFYTGLQAQNFEYVSSSPFNIEIVDLTDSSRVGFNYKFFDDDQDGDLDLFIFGIDEVDSTSNTPAIEFNLNYFMSYQENIGSKTFPQFAKRKDKYPNFEYPKRGGFMIPTIGDLNGDGLVDFVMSSEVDIYNTQYLQFQIQNPDGTFTVTNCEDWQLPPFLPYSFFIPELVDLDSDGDLDILMGGYMGIYNMDSTVTQKNQYLYAKNIGTPSSPEFLGWFNNPYDLVPEGQSFLSGGDVDLDGDMDLINLKQGEDFPVLSFVENIGGPGMRPQFDTPIDNALGLPVAQEEESFLFPTLVDIDGDGDLDLFLPFLKEETFALEYYENDICTLFLSQVSASICFGESYTFEGETYSIPGNYTISSVDANGCSVITELELNVFEEIDLNLTVDASTIIAVDNINYMYSWVDCNTGQSIANESTNTFVAPYTGSFAVEITDEFGCVEMSDCISVIISSSNELSIKNKIELWPTITQSYIYIRSEIDIEQIDIYNTNGQKVSLPVKIKDGYIDLSQLDNGIYFLKISVMDQQMIQRVIRIK